MSKLPSLPDSHPVTLYSQFRFVLEIEDPPLGELEA